MIRIIDDYVVTTDAYNFTLAKDTGKVDKKTGTPITKPISHHNCLENAVLACRQEYVRRGLQDGVISLSDAVNTTREADARFTKLVRECLNVRDKQ